MDILDVHLFSDNMFDSLIEALNKFDYAQEVYFRVCFSDKTLDTAKTIEKVVEHYIAHILGEDKVDRLKIAEFHSAKNQVKSDITGAVCLTINISVQLDLSMKSLEEVAFAAMDSLSVQLKDYVKLH